ncbi:unnamed protein product [Oreochromis niloticus]|nr:unnamed protein product [Mustela putorius furo]
MSEWNRRSHFNNPFGFMEYRYDDVMDSVKLIPKPKEPMLLPKPGDDGCVRCAVVGTGGILNGSKKGVEIDGHDYVFRPRTYYSGQYNESRVYVLHQDFLRYVRNRQQCQHEQTYSTLPVLSPPAGKMGNICSNLLKHVQTYMEIE